MGLHEAPEQPEEAVPAVDTPSDPVPPPDDGEDRPEPVLSAARVAGVVSGVILTIGGVLKLVGWLIPSDYDLQALADQIGNAILALGAAWSLFGPWITARFRARDLVTPLASPRDADGRRLVPEER
jgi:hypothetical protein